MAFNVTLWKNYGRELLTILNTANDFVVSVPLEEIGCVMWQDSIDFKKSKKNANKIHHKSLGDVRNH